MVNGPLSLIMVWIIFLKDKSSNLTLKWLNLSYFQKCLGPLEEEDSDCSRPSVQNPISVNALRPSELEEFIVCISHLGSFPALLLAVSSILWSHLGPISVCCSLLWILSGGCLQQKDGNADEEKNDSEEDECSLAD
ncbi:hypothetical protein RDI58_017665 [Solanum bulbocastanum]|uniref:Uncharacterized protein n=1 Tax=Solanum bulbocastanum TaxID=147425 RepID=A0AAN8YA68_SOLBU